MRLGLLTTVRSLLQALALHAVVVVLLVFSFEFTPAPETPPKVNVVKAVAVDTKEVEKELQRLADQEQAKKDAELKQQQELERKAAEAKKRREAEERKLAEIKKQKEQEIKRQKATELKRKQLEKEKQDLEKQKQLELEKKQKAEAERKRLEAEKKKLEAERKRKEEEARKAENERKRKEEEARKAEEEQKRREAEEALQAELEAEQLALQEQQDLTEIQKYSALIARSVESKFNKLGLSDGLSCEILIRLLEGGKVAEATIAKSSGNDLFDKRAETAVYSASPLPVPPEQRVFNKMRTIQITFRPKS